MLFPDNSGGFDSSPIGVLRNAFTQMFEMAGLISINAADEDLFHESLVTIVAKVHQMAAGGVLIFPGGWSRGEEGHVLLYILHKYRGKDGFSFTVVNTGEGVEYHACKINPDTTEPLTNLSLTVENVPAHHVADSAFWFFLFRMQVYPDEVNGPQLLYEKLIPFLGGRPLMSNVTDESTWRPLPRGSDSSLFLCLMECMRHTLIVCGMAQAEAQHISVLLRWTFITMAKSDLGVSPGEVTGSDAILIRTATKQLAMQASECVASAQSPMTITQLRDIEKTLLGVDERLREIRGDLDTMMQPKLELNIAQYSGATSRLMRFTSGQRLTGAVSHPFFGRLRRDFDVEKLVGAAREPPILLPVQLTLVPETVGNFNDVIIAMRHCDDLCTTLANQVGLVKNTYLQRATLIHHLFLRVIPLPLPPNHPRRNDKCFWATQPIKYAEQEALLRLLEQLCCHFSAAVLSLRVTQSFDAARLLTTACIVTLADCILRKDACDVPSVFTQHFNGTADGPISPFGIEMRYFAVETETSMFLAPELSKVRTQILDYFVQLRKLIRDDHILFQFERSMKFGPGEHMLMTQLCLATGFPPDAAVPLFTGEQPIFLEKYPALGRFRNIVFHFKMMMSPTSDALPEMRAWHPSDPLLVWSSGSGKAALQMKVAGFGKGIPMAWLQGDQTEESGLRTFLKKMLGKGKPRVMPSGSDPSVIVGEPVTSEDDVLHLRHLPDFDGRLRARDCELLLQYLTAPYVRIPLVMQLFSDPVRMTALGSLELQRVLDAVLFEPGEWQSTAEKSVPDAIPGPDRDHLSTPCGLLFNELQNSPGTLLSCMHTMLEHCLELDQGKYTGSIGFVILYVVRLVVRVEGYMLFMLRNPDLSLRGVETSADQRGVLREGQQKLRARLNDAVFQMLEEWVDRAAREKNIVHMCLIRAHLAFMFKNASADDLDFKSVSTLLCSQLFLDNNYRFDADVSSGIRSDVTSRTGADEHVDQSLCIGQTEMFDIFQQQRRRVLEWLQGNPDDCNEVMESVIRVLTYTGSRDPALMAVTKSLSPRHWHSLGGAPGRFVPDTEAREDGADSNPDEEVGETATYEQWLRSTTQAVETEINVQLGQFTLRKQQLQLLDDEIQMQPEMLEIFGEGIVENPIQCAEVANTANRSWLRLVGRRHDIQYWTVDERPLPIRDGMFSRSRRYPDDLDDSEDWISQALEPWREEHLSGIDLHLPSSKAKSDALFAVLKGYEVVPEGEERDYLATTKEVLVLRYPPTVHVYNIVEGGRRFFRSLIFSSDTNFCLHDLQPNPIMKNSVPGLTCGDAATSAPREQSVVITRNLNKQMGPQTLIPRRFLQGLLPSALLEEYEFWQNEDDSISGYMRASSNQESDDTVARRPTMLQIELLKDSGRDTDGWCSSDASAIVRRVPLLERPEEEHKQSSNEDVAGFNDVNCIPDPDQPVDTLISLLYAPKESVLRDLCQVVMRLDGLSHCMAWTKAPVKSPEDACSVDLVEFPRLRLSFHTKREVDKESGAEVMRLYSNDHDGLFISNHRSEMTENLIYGVPHALLMENVANELFVLMPAGTCPLRPEVPGVLFSHTILLNRSDEGWLRNLGDVRHYLYPVHQSRTFIFAPTLSSSLYMMVMQFLLRKYRLVFQLSDSCVSDTELSGEERQIFEHLQYLRNDVHPDAHACRLKIHLAVAGCSAVMQCPWDISNELKEYVKLNRFVSAECRLTTAEEIMLLERCEAQNYMLSNRLQFLRAHTASGTETIDLRYPRRPGFVEFDTVMDKTCLVLPDKQGLTDKMSTISYSRPTMPVGPTEAQPEAKPPGPQVVKKLADWTRPGRLRVGGGKDNTGFLFFYELMTGALTYKIFPTDNCYTLAALLIRMLPEAETDDADMLMSLLRIMVRNKEMTPQMPKYQDDRKLKISTMFRGQSVLSTLLQKVHDFVTKHQSSIKWCSEDQEYVQPLGMQVRKQSAERPLRHFVAPRLDDCSKSIRQFRTVQSADISILPQELASFATFPLNSIGLQNFVELTTREQRGLQPVVPGLPFSVDRHPWAQAHVSLEMTRRLQDDALFFAEHENNNKVPQIKHLLDADLQAALSSRDASRLGAAVRKVDELVSALEKLKAKDDEFVRKAVPHTLELVSRVDRTRPEGLAFALAQYSGKETKIWFELLVLTMLSHRSEQELAMWNPFLSPAEIQTTHDLVVGVMATAVRFGQIVRCLQDAATLREQLVGAQKLSVDSRVADAAVIQSLKLQTDKLATNLATKRHYVRRETASGAEVLQYDPRFLVFEFTYGLMFRQQQVELIGTLMSAVQKGNSLCHQLLMGEGKTTVIGPLLALLLADGKSLVTQVVPSALLEFSRSVMREKFSAIVRKSIFTFAFDRMSKVTEELHSKLSVARDTKAVVCTHPTAVKSFALKLIEMLIALEESFSQSTEQDEEAPLTGFALRMLRRFGISKSARREYTEEQIASMRHQCQLSVRILEIFRNGALLLDEVDMILHPLKSELNWPMGGKKVLDLTRNKAGNGLRWQIPWFLFEAMLGTHFEVGLTVDLQSRAAQGLLKSIRDEIEQGRTQKLIQTTPHIVLLSREFYNQKLRPLLSRWMTIWLQQKRVNDVSDDKIVSFLQNGPLGDPATAEAINQHCSDDHVKMLNLAHDWLDSFLPFTLSKIDRVNYGLLSADDLARFLKKDPRTPAARKLLAVPFVGKDVPSQASIFSHPDVVIGLTILAYRYEGLRRSDFRMKLQDMQEEMEDETGPYHTRQSCIQYARWIELAGGRVRGFKRTKKKSPKAGASAAPDSLIGFDDVAPADSFRYDSIWPLHLLDVHDTEQVDLLYSLLARLPHIIHSYLSDYIFPEMMRFQDLRLSANGQELGGDLIFQRRLGFSGTPSDLLPVELGRCQYRKGDDGRMLHYLSSPAIMSLQALGVDWTVNKLLDLIASGPYAALIDTGALITGLTNEEGAPIN